jgi:hypothetical protein
MRTAKTLLIAAAALAATVTASKAQTVYSQNVVGYVNVTVTNNTLALVANQLDTGSNTMDNVFQTGMASQKTFLLEWTGSGYNQYQYFNTSDANNSFLSAGPGWYNYVTGNFADTTPSVWPSAGQSFFIHNESATAPIKWTNVFEVQ